MYLDEESLYKVLGGHLYMTRPLQFAREDLLIDPKWVVVVERWVTWNTFSGLSKHIVCFVFWGKHKNDDPKRHNFVGKAHLLTSRK